MTTSVTASLRFRVTFISWWIVWIAIQAMVISSYDNTLTQSVADSILCNVLLAAFCLLIIFNMKFYLPQKERYWYVLIMSFVLSGIWLLKVKFLLKLIFKSDTHYLIFLDQSIYIRFVIGFLMIGCMAIMSLLWYTLQEQQEANRRKELAEQMTKDAELLKLRQQLQPHFLFNSLNSISALAGSQPEKARHMIQQLSDFLRGTLKRDEQQSVTLEEELHHLELYLDIEKVRFGSRLQTDIQVDEEAKKMLIPALLLQPIVENAIKFGLYDTTGEVMITLFAKQEAQQLEVTITNPFDEETAASTQGTGFGLASIQRRLYLLFARHDLLKTSKKDSVFTTILLIPQHYYESNNH
ncbi:MAG: histidine kinase [Bacteroidota bacterium]